MGPSWLEVASITDGPGPEAASSAMELHVSMMKVLAGIGHAALRPNAAPLVVYVTFTMPTLLPEEYSKEYL